MAKPLADCRIRIEFPKSGKTYNIGLFGTPMPGKLLMKLNDSVEEVTPTQLGQRLGKWIGENHG